MKSKRNRLKNFEFEKPLASKEGAWRCLLWMRSGTEHDSRRTDESLFSIKHVSFEERGSVEVKMAIKVRWKFTCSVFICIFSACFLKLVNGINLGE